MPTASLRPSVSQVGPEAALSAPCLSPWFPSSEPHTVHISGSYQDTARVVHCSRDLATVSVLGPCLYLLPQTRSMPTSLRHIVPPPLPLHRHRHSVTTSTTTECSGGSPHLPRWARIFRHTTIAHLTPPELYGGGLSLSSLYLRKLSLREIIWPCLR